MNTVILVLIFLILVISFVKPSIIEGYTFLLNTLTIMVSKKRATVIHNKRYILDSWDPGFYFIVFSNNTVKYIERFECLTRMIDFIDVVDPNDLCIVVSTGEPFCLLSNSTDPLSRKAKEALKKLGANVHIFRQHDNYLLITSPANHIYYEQISPEPLYYPNIDITKKHCKINPGNLQSPNKYIYFNDKTFDLDRVQKCAMETTLRNYTKFGIDQEYCIPMSDKEYNTHYLNMENSTDCVNGVGAAGSLSGYVFDTSNPFAGVTFFELENFEGNSFVLNEGEYDSTEFNRNYILSSIVPATYHLFLISNRKIYPFYGPVKTNLPKISIDMIIIQKHLEGNIKICDGTVCVTYPRGKFILHPSLFLKYTDIDLGDTAGCVELYGNLSLTDLISQNCRQQGSLSKIKYPRIVKSIIVDRPATEPEPFCRKILK
jgi:hypothetical protein